MEFVNPKDERLKSIKEFLSDKNKKLIFLFFLDDKKLLERINSREEVSEYDKVAIEKQRLYIDAYESLKDDYDNVSAIDTTSLNEQQLAQFVKDQYIYNEKE